MNRFVRPDLKKRILESVNVSIAFFVLVMVLFLLGISMLSSSSVNDDEQILRNAINKDINEHKQKARTIDLPFSFIHYRYQ